MDEVWNDLWKGIRELTDLFPDDIVFIGGVAVYLHVESAMSSGAADVPEAFIEYSHDGDFYIAGPAFNDLREFEEVDVNKRLNKHQFVKRGIEFDVYVERRNGLLVRYEDVVANSVVLDDVRVACLEHLLLLKLVAYDDRRGTAKGGKDERDLIRILYMLSMRRPPVSKTLLAPYITSSHLRVLSTIDSSNEFVTVCGGNLHRARQIRGSVSKVISSIRTSMGLPRRRTTRR